MEKDECVSCNCMDTMVDLIVTATLASDAVEFDAYNIKSPWEHRFPDNPEFLEAAKPLNRVKDLVDAMTKAENECGFKRTARGGRLRGIDMMKAVEELKQRLEYGPANAGDMDLLDRIHEGIRENIGFCELNKYKCEL